MFFSKAIPPSSSVTLCLCGESPRATNAQEIRRAAKMSRKLGNPSPVILSEEGRAGVSVRISNYEKHGLCHGLRILRSSRSLTPTRPR
jgi:hypothetical protein